jgi:predicted dehydrogenase
VTPPLRLAVVGLGSIAREVQLPSLRRLPGVEVVGLVDPVPATLAQAMAETGLGPGFASLEHFVACVRTRAEPRAPTRSAPRP